MNVAHYPTINLVDLKKEFDLRKLCDYYWIWFVYVQIKCNILLRKSSSSCCHMREDNLPVGRIVWKIKLRY
ncbi:hypothetical protein BGI36_04665 [Snodgrassella communis]|nr:hypothetical protein BGI36_04665 [Snodgrassella communis]